MYRHHYADHLLVDDFGREVKVKTYELSDGRLLQEADNGMYRHRPAPATAEGAPDHKRYPQYGLWQQDGKVGG
jgi:hypothetical protein